MTNEITFSTTSFISSSSGKKHGIRSGFFALIETGINEMKLIGLAFFAFMLFSINLSAHTWEIRVVQNQDGTLTWYGQSYHNINECGFANSGININGVNYNWTAAYAGSDQGQSPYVFMVSPSRNSYNISCGGCDRKSYASVTTPYIGGNLSVTAYSTNACFALYPDMPAGNGAFTPPPPPVCTSCPVTGWSNTTSNASDNNTPCVQTDDVITVDITVTHLACASITGDGQFTVVFDPAGANIVYGPFNYDVGITTLVSFNVPYSTSNSTQVKVFDNDFPCNIQNGLSIPEGIFLGVIETVPPTINCSSNITLNNSTGLCSGFATLESPAVSDNCTSSKIGLSFDGINDYVSGPNDVVPVTGEYTVAVWAKQVNNHPNQFREIFAQGRNLYLGQSNTGIIRVGDSWGNTGVIFPTDNQWHHYAVVRKINNTHLYIDGALVASKGSSIPSPGVNPPWPHNFMVGSQWSPGEFFDGQIDEIQIWNYALQQQQISCNMNQRLIGNEIGLVAYYNFQDGTGSSVLTDVVNSSHNANLINMDVNTAWIVSPQPPSDVNLVNDYTNTCDASDVYPVGTTTVTWTATDASGNTSTCEQTVTVIDNQIPVPTCEAAQTISLNANCELEVPDLIDAATANDNCSSSFTWSQSPEAGDLLASGEGTTHTITVTADDGNGNTASCTVVLTGDDNTDPVPTCEAAQTISLNANCELEVPDLIDGATATDNCSTTFSWTQSPAAGTLLASGEGTTHEVTVTVDDGNGNSETCTVVLTGDDVTAPVPTCEDPQTPSLNANCEFEVPDLTDGATATDNCSTTFSWIQSPATGELLASGEGTTHTITVTADDGNGNTASCTVVLTGDDNTDPVPTCEDPQTISLNANCELEVPDLIDGATASDNCSTTFSWTQSPAAGELLASGEGTTHTVTVTADDGNGNTASCTIVLTGDDAISPVPTCEDPQTVSLNSNCELEVPDLTDGATATDNCSTSFSWTQSPAAGELLASGEGTMHTVTVTSDDGNGNTASCTVVLTGDDNNAPLIGCQDVTVYLDETGNASVSTAEINDLTTDNCGEFSLSLTGKLNYNCDDLDDSFVVTLIANDGNGNESTCSATVTVSDDTLPDDDCDGVSNICDICPGGDDSVDNNGDGLPDCKYPPAYNDIIEAWKCGNNKVYVCHIPPGNPNNKQTLCISYNALQSHIDNHGDYLGQCGNANCNGGAIKGDFTNHSVNEKGFENIHVDKTSMQEGELILYPNPAQNEIIVILNSHTHSPIQIQITNNMGIALFSNQYVENGEENSVILINTESFNNGLYFVKVMIDGNESVKTFSIIK